MFHDFVVVVVIIGSITVMSSAGYSSNLNIIFNNLAIRDNLGTKEC